MERVLARRIAGIVSERRAGFLVVPSFTVEFKSLSVMVPNSTQWKKWMRNGFGHFMGAILASSSFLLCGMGSTTGSESNFGVCSLIWGL